MEKKNLRAKQNKMTKIEETEIQKFDAWAEDWWNPNGPCKPLHEINPLRLSFIQQQVKLENKTVLDVGCGGGILAEAMAKHDAEVTGIDVSSAVIESAKCHAQESKLNIRYQALPIDAFNHQNNNPFDVITCMELLEHVEDPAVILQHCARLLKPGGHLFLSTINRNAKSFCFAILGAEYVLGLLPRGTHTYAQFIRPSELTRWCLAHHLKPHILCGMTYHPISQKYRLTDNCDVNYLLYAQKTLY